jgi:tetratricopeptide (TPR) repeat protein
MTSPDRVFISHSVSDKPYARALERAIDALSEGRLDVRYSTSSEAGPQGGTQWREWIDEQVVLAKTTLVVVTPASLAKPWLMWEAGACRGVALGEAPDARANRMLVTIAYGLADAECPDPLRAEQIVGGVDRERVGALLTSILAHHGLPSTMLVAAGGRMGAVLDAYTAEVQEALLQSASLPTEANIREWVSRLDELAAADRLSELDGFVRWMRLAFGRQEGTPSTPIDIRLHRRLGQLFLGARDYDRAVDELKLARLAAPRDIFVLRPLGEAYLKRYGNARRDATSEGEVKEIERLLAMIEEIDPDAYVASPDAAALQSKFYRRVVGDLTKAAEVLRASLERNRDSYYLADLLGQTLLDAGQQEDAKDAFRHIPAILDRTGDQSTWAMASRVSAALADLDLEVARTTLDAIRASRATPTELASIAQGVREMAARFGIADASIADVLAGYPT